MAGHVSSRTGLQEIGAVSDREFVATTIFSPLSKGKRDRDTNVVHLLKRQKISKKNLERKVDSVVRGEMMAQQKLYEAEAEVDMRNWSRRNSDFAFLEINQEFESQRFQLHQASRWADQVQRDKISMYVESELRNRLFQEDHARDCQEIEELRRICCEETDRARRLRIDELSMQREESYDRESALDSNSGFDGSESGITE